MFQLTNISRKSKINRDDIAIQSNKKSQILADEQQNLGCLVDMCEEGVEDVLRSFIKTTNYWSKTKIYKYKLFKSELEILIKRKANLLRPNVKNPANQKRAFFIGAKTADCSR